MKYLIISICAILITLCTSAEARRGGGGGGRGGGTRGSAYHGGKSISRSPSLSRARPIQHSHNRLPQSSQNRSTLDQARRNQAFQRAHARSGNQELKERAGNFQSNQSLRDQSNRLQARKLQNRVNRNWPGYNDWFGNDFYRRRNWTPNYYNSNTNWWRGAGWGAVSAWGPWDYNSGYYYDDGGYPIEVVSQDASPSASVPEASASDWMPLGVFAIGQTFTQASNANMFIQLALSKKGEISGTFYNALTDAAYPIEGSLEHESQQVTFTSTKSNAPVVSTGLYNLTKDVTPVIVHFSDGTKQTWSLVRVSK